MITGHVAEAEALDRAKRGTSHVDRVNSRSTRSDQHTWLLKGVITAQIKRVGENPDRQIAIQGAKSHVFYNASHQISSGPSIKIRRPRHFRNGPRWTVPS